MSYPLCYVVPSYLTPLVSTVYVSEWSNFYIIYIEGEEETKAEPDPNTRTTFRVP